MYVKDAQNLGTKNFFKQTNPEALQEITAIMLETARKGMWKATDAQLTDIASLVKEFGSSGAGFAGGNIKLQDFYFKESIYRKCESLQSADTTNEDSDSYI